MNTKLLSISLILIGFGLVGLATINESTDLPIVSYFNDKPEIEAWLGFILMATGAFLLMPKNK